MTKQTRKAMKASVINEVSKQYKESYGAEICNLQNTIKIYMEENAKLRKSYLTAKQENEKLKNKLNKCVEIIIELRKFCNLPEKDKEEILKEFELNKKIHQDLMKCFGYLNLVQNIYSINQ